MDRLHHRPSRRPDANGAAGRSATESFYVSGTFQLWILERLLGPVAMRSVTEEIERSTQPDGAKGGVFGHFESLIRER